MILPGDVIRFGALPGLHVGNVVPWLIRLICGNRTVHVGVVESADANGNVVYWDLNPGGVKCRRIRVGGESSNGLKMLGVSRWSGRHKALTSIGVRRACAGLELVGYGYSVIFSLAWLHLRNRLATRKFPRNGEALFESGGMTCSQFVTEVYKRIGRNLKFDGVRKASWQVEPDDFVNGREWMEVSYGPEPETVRSVPLCEERPRVFDV